MRPVRVTDQARFRREDWCGGEKVVSEGEMRVIEEEREREMRVCQAVDGFPGVGWSVGLGPIEVAC